MPMTDKLEIVQIPTGQIKEWPRNPKKHNQAAINASVEAFGVRQPIIVVPDGDGYRIVAGHGRIKAFAAAGLSDVPCIVWDETNRELIDAYAIADNQLTMAAGWDEPMLGDILKDIEIGLPDFDMSALGFGDIEPHQEPREPEDKEIKYFERTHILLSFPPDMLPEIIPLLESLKDVPEIEIEQSSN